MRVPAKVERTAKAIRTLRIQGARNIARASLKAVEGLSGKTLEAAVEVLRKARPTEPMTFNLLEKVLAGEDPTHLLEEMEESLEAVVKNAVPLLRRKSVITICHSSTVIEALKEAGPERVLVQETRPRYQGRKTAKELVKSGIEVVLYPDSAMAQMLEEAQVCVFGADAFLSDGSVVNKVGSLALATFSHLRGIPVYSLGERWKFFFPSVRGEGLPLEERDPKEVWKAPPKGLKIRNPAFDRVPRHLLTAIVSEFGVLPPSVFVGEVKRWMEKGRKRN